MKSGLVLIVGLVASVGTFAVEASTDAWDYLTVRDINELSKAISDPTNNCEKAPALTVMGHLGWEMVQVVVDTSRELGVAKGAISLSPMTGQGQRGTLELRSENRVVPPYAIFKRRVPHVGQSLKPCA